MPTTAAESCNHEVNKIVTPSDRGRLAASFLHYRVVRELLIVVAFCLFTSAVTWPYVTRLRDAVVDRGDPYLITWILWWDYHQTFTDPLHLFNANLFYPLKYTLAFSENSYGIALLFFPLYALGLKPLTVHAIALFFGFALSGYGAFRLGRTLTGSTAVGWIAGIIFAFVPYRFHLMSQVAYVFSPWIPLLFEALVLYTREPSRKRAAWLGCAFFMNGLTTISWFTFSLIPFAIFAAILATRYGLWRERDFWRRGAVALSTAMLLLLPFFLPYVMVSRLYGFKRSIEEIKANSAWPIHWLSVESRNRLWRTMGDNIPEGYKFKLFPGLLPILFSLAAMPRHGVATRRRVDLLSDTAAGITQERWLRRLDTLIIIAFAVSIPAIGFDRTDAFRGLFRHLTSEVVLAVLTVAVLARLCLAYPRFLINSSANLVDTLRSRRRCDAFWLGMLLTLTGFCFSLGWNFFFYRICYDLIPMFRSMRVASRGAILAYLGLALLAGLGVKHLAAVLPARIPRLRASIVCSVSCALLLAELNAAPLRVMRGEVFPDAVTLRLKQTPMRGGIAELPAGGDFNYRYTLRSADHQKPIIVGTSGFNSPIEDRIEELTRTGAISPQLMDLLETVPASYLVIANQSIVPERKIDYGVFLSTSIAAGRLRFINRFDGHDDLYAVVKNEPGAKSEVSLPFDLALHDWAAKISEDPVNLLTQPINWSQKLYRLYLASSGSLPKFKDFIGDMEIVGRGVVLGSEAQEQQFENNFHGLAEDWMNRETNLKLFGGLTNEQYVDRLLGNSALSFDAAGREALVKELSSGQQTRTSTLMKIVEDPRFIEKEKFRSLVVLHYFGYFRRNPGDPPDHNLDGLNFWIQDLERNHNPGKLSAAFMESIEYTERGKASTKFQ